MYDKLTAQIKGTVPLMMNNVQRADPLNRWSKELKVLTAKRKKTDADYVEMALVEFRGGLVLDTQSRPVVKAEQWEASIRESARKTKAGKKAQAAILVQDDTPIAFSGPKAMADREADPACRDYRSVVVSGRTRVMRCRPIFRDWSCSLTIHYDPLLANLSEVREWLVTAGREVGVGEWRTSGRFGRFEVTY
jgi:hypothetical protein